MLSLCIQAMYLIWNNHHSLKQILPYHQEQYLALLKNSQMYLGDTHTSQNRHHLVH